MDDQRKISIGVAVAAVIALYFALPVWRAWQRYETAPTYSDKCRAAQEVADEWGSLGFASKREEWQGTINLDCMVARHKP